MKRSHEIRVGTSGWSYPSGKGTWNGIFYPRQPARRPRGAPKFDELTFYAEHFDTVEVNSTFYRVPTVDSGAEVGRADACRIRVLAEAVPEVHPSRDVREGDRRGSVQRSAGRTSTSSAPRSIRWRTPASSARCSRSSPRASRTTTNRAATWSGCSKAFKEYPVAVELRHRSWSDDATETAQLLSGFDAALAQIDEPKFKTSIRQTLLPNVKHFLLPAPARPQRRAVVEAREVGGPLQLSVHRRRS